MTGLDAGADDYLVKPFALELNARLQALVRRGKGQAQSVSNTATSCSCRIRSKSVIVVRKSA